MLEKFKNLKGSAKALIIGAVVLGVIVIGLMIAVICTGGFTSPF